MKIISKKTIETTRMKYQKIRTGATTSDHRNTEYDVNFDELIPLKLEEANEGALAAMLSDWDLSFLFASRNNPSGQNPRKRKTASNQLLRDQKRRRIEGSRD
jgi:hypothetical protein